MCHTYQFTHPCGHKLSIPITTCINFGIPPELHPDLIASHATSRLDLGDPGTDCNICIQLESTSSPTPTAPAQITSSESDYVIGTSALLDRQTRNIWGITGVESPSPRLKELLEQRRRQARERAEGAAFERGVRDMEDGEDVEGQRTRVWVEEVQGQGPGAHEGRIEDKVLEDEAINQLWNDAVEFAMRDQQQVTVPGLQQTPALSQPQMHGQSQQATPVLSQPQIHVRSHQGSPDVFFQTPERIQPPRVDQPTQTIQPLMPWQERAIHSWPDLVPYEPVQGHMHGPIIPTPSIFGPYSPTHPGPPAWFGQQQQQHQPQPMFPPQTPTRQMRQMHTHYSPTPAGRSLHLPQQQPHQQPHQQPNYGPYMASQVGMQSPQNVQWYAGTPSAPRSQGFLRGPPR